MMITKLLSDLRFVIGLFFTCVAIILVIAGATTGNVITEGVGNLNFISAGIMGVFGLFMLALAFRDSKR